MQRLFCASWAPGVEVTKLIASFALFYRFSNIVKTLVIYRISRSYLTDVEDSAVVTSTKDESDSKMVTGIFAKKKQSQIFCNGEINERSFVKTHPWNWRVTFVYKDKMDGKQEV